MSLFLFVSNPHGMFLFRLLSSQLLGVLWDENKHGRGVIETTSCCLVGILVVVIWCYVSIQRQQEEVVA